MKIQQFVEELQRRHVFKVAGGYLLACWFAIEVSNTVFQILDLPNFYSQVVLYLAIAGLPVTLVLAWMFDFTKDGIVRTPKYVRPEERAGMPGSAPAPGVVLSNRAAGMFGLGVLVCMISLAAYTRSHVPSSSVAGTAADTLSLANINAIAVMPFEDISPEKNQQSFAQGMTEDLVSRLGTVENLQIISGQGYATPSRGGDLQTVASRLKVQAILEGTVSSAQDSVRVFIKLTNPATNKILYSQSFTRSMANMFKVQDDIADAVASSLQVHMAAGSGDASEGTTNRDAYEFYIQGTTALNERTDAKLRNAIGFFNEAIRLDPQYAQAYAGLAQTYAVLPTVGSFDFQEAGTKGMAAATNAIALDPTLAEAHAAIGQITQNLSWNPRMAENSYKRAIENRPGGYAAAHQWYAETLAMLGRMAEAKQHALKASELQPFSPAVKNTLGYVLTIAGDLDSALVVFRNENKFYPDYRLGHLTHALTAITAKKYDEAEVAARAYAGDDTRLADDMVTVIRASALKVPRAEGLRAAAALEPKLGAGFTALWFGALNDHDGALHMVQKAYKAGKDANFPYFVIHPLLNTLHGDPKYQQIVDEMGIVPAR